MRQKVKGFTLPELLLAAAILGFVLVSLLFLFTSCLFLNESSRDLTFAVSHAEYVMEDIKNTSFPLIPAKAGTMDATAITVVGLTPMTSESIVTAVSGTGILTVTVTVNWSQRGVRSRSAVLTTKIARP